MKAIRGTKGNVNAVDDARQKRRGQRKTTSNRNPSNRNQSNCNPSNPNQSNHNQGNSNQGNQRAKQKCFKCGNSRLDKQEICLAKNTICYCNGRNHFATVCHKKRNKETTNQVEESSYEYEENSEVSDYEDDMNLHPVYAVDKNTSRQEMDDKWQGKKVRMQLDTGTKTMQTTIQHVSKPSEETTTSEDHSQIDVVFGTPARH